MLKSIFKTENDISLLILRVTLGLVMFPHGAQKMLGWFGGYGFSGTMGFFTQQMQIPAVFALLAILAEFAGALGLITGLLTRVSALGIAAVMVVAILTSHLQYGFFMNWYGNQQGEGFEYHLLALGLALPLILKGGGLVSLDKLISSRLFSRDS